MIRRYLIALLVISACTGCGINPYTEYYTPTPGYASLPNPEPTKFVQLIEGDYISPDSPDEARSVIYQQSFLKMIKKGYKCLGYSSFDSSYGMQIDKMEEHAQSIGAHAVVYFKQHLYTTHKQIPVTLQSPGLGDTIKIEHPSGSATKIRVPKTYSVSSTEDRYSIAAVFWRRLE